jgi:hypothetical protein
MNGAVLGRINDNATDVHVWVITSMSSTVSSYFEIKANTDTATLEVSFATNEQGTTGIGCGIQLRSMGSYSTCARLTRSRSLTD